MFVSDTEYFAAANLKTMDDNLGSAYTVHATYSHGLIFSSDPMNACYQLSASSLGSIIPMTSETPSSEDDDYSIISYVSISTDGTSASKNLVYDKITRVTWCV